TELSTLAIRSESGLSVGLWVSDKSCLSDEDGAVSPPIS
ncbi:MAG: hypothetical protein ACI9HI_000224, partial [Salinirussus sp.]